jgi:hypothetical protein
MGQCLKVPRPIWLDLVDVSLVSLRELAFGKRLEWNLSCIYVCDLQSNVLQIHVELG